MEAKITNVILEGNRFKVFATINMVDEVEVFMPDCTATSIKDWVSERVRYYEELEAKEQELKDQLINTDIWQS